MIIIAIPGKKTRWGAEKTWFLSEPSIVPHSGIGGCAPSPKKESPAASKIAVAIPRVAKTTTGVKN